MTDAFLPTVSPAAGSTGGYPFADSPAVHSKGAITRVECRASRYVDAIRFVYGTDGYGEWHGGQGGNAQTWDVPQGQNIVRIEGSAGAYVDRVQFFTDHGIASPSFGGGGGRAFSFQDPDGGQLRSVAGRASAYVDMLVFEFGAPYFLQSIKYDMDALKQAALGATPKVLLHQELSNRTDATQTTPYSHSESVTKTQELSFSVTAGLKFGIEIEEEVPGIKGKESTEFSLSTTAGSTYSTSTEETVQWSIPVKVPPHSKVTAVSTLKRFEATIPFTYTVAWYQGNRANVVKTETFQGHYKGVQVDDVQHDFRETPLRRKQRSQDN